MPSMLTLLMLKIWEISRLTAKSFGLAVCNQSWWDKIWFMNYFCNEDIFQSQVHMR